MPFAQQVQSPTHRTEMRMATASPKQNRLLLDRQIQIFPPVGRAKNSEKTLGIWMLSACSSQCMQLQRDAEPWGEKTSATHRFISRSCQFAWCLNDEHNEPKEQSCSLPVSCELSRSTATHTHCKQLFVPLEKNKRSIWIHLPISSSVVWHTGCSLPDFTRTEFQPEHLKLKQKSSYLIMTFGAKVFFLLLSWALMYPLRLLFLS